MLTMIAQRPQPNAHRMRRMIETVRAAGVTDESVLAAMAQIPRELFVARTFSVDAYDDACLPIGEQQTISMPSVVARMTAALNLSPTDKVLEIGTGCGYQTALLSKLARRVYTIERLAGLSATATPRLTAMGIHNFTAMVGDGTLGWPAQSPFNAIIVTAAGPKVPQALLDQLAPGGKLVIPVGASESTQKLVRITKAEDGTHTEEILGPVVFVPLVGQQGVAVPQFQPLSALRRRA
jgi:protein-L-isoaspartate(D-aspartate) O-methyltransferase